MFVRWQKRKRADGRNLRWSWVESLSLEVRHDREGDLLVASLVESIRIDGKPRQRVVGYLGSIRENLVTDPQAQRDFWGDGRWDGVRHRLDRLADRITPKDRASIETKIAAKVPRPPHSEQGDE